MVKVKILTNKIWVCWSCGMFKDDDKAPVCGHCTEEMESAVIVTQKVEIGDE